MQQHIGHFHTVPANLWGFAVSQHSFLRWGGGAIHSIMFELNASKILHPTPCLLLQISPYWGKNLVSIVMTSIDTKTPKAELFRFWRWFISEIWGDSLLLYLPSSSLA